MAKPLLIDLIEVAESILILRMTMGELGGWEQSGEHKVVQSTSCFHRLAV